MANTRYIDMLEGYFTSDSRGASFTYHQLQFIFVRRYQLVTTPFSLSVVPPTAATELVEYVGLSSFRVLHRRTTGTARCDPAISKRLTNSPINQPLMQYHHTRARKSQQLYYPVSPSFNVPPLGLPHASDPSPIVTLIIIKARVAQSQGMNPFCLKEGQPCNRQWCCNTELSQNIFARLKRVV